MNRDTAITEFGLNAYNQNNPWGTTSWQQSGTWADGTPRFEQTTTFSPEQQAIFDQTQAAEGNLAQIANQQSNFLQDYLGQQIDTSGLPGLNANFGPNFSQQFSGDLGLQTDLGLATQYAGADDFSADRQRYEDALWDRTAGDRSAQEQSLRTQLANKGIREGTAAWNAEMERMQRQNTDARLATVLAGGTEQQRMVDMARQAAEFGNASRLAQGTFGNDALMQQGQFGMAAQQAQNQASMQEAGFGNDARGQGFAELMAMRNQPLNEISALLSGSQVSNPAGMNAAGPSVGVGGVDYAGMVNQNYQNQLQAHQNKWGGIGGLFGSALGAAGQAGGFGALFSDRRLKENIRRIGQTDSGLPIYTYTYGPSGAMHMGVMADEAQAIFPEAVIEDESGYLKVNYAELR